LVGVYVIGIKEEPSHSVTLPTEQMIGAGQVAAAALKELPETKSSSTDTQQAAVQLFQSLCTEYTAEIEAGKITREHLKMIVADVTGVDIGKLT
jgi:hypothetical protein